MIRFIPFEENGKTGFSAFDGETKIGSCEIELDGYTVRFSAVNCSDDIITEGLARAAMNYAANRNAYIALIGKELSSTAFERLGFKGSEILSVEIPEALASGCSCGDSKQ